MLPPPPKPTAADDEVLVFGGWHGWPYLHAATSPCICVAGGVAWCSDFICASVCLPHGRHRRGNPCFAQDIFGDAGTDYELPERRAGDAAGTAARNTYFDRKDEMRDLPALPSGAQGSC
jgi:hypothetical protein